MIPIRLSIKGMYSYRTEQTIDFTPLVKNHLFGIFGPVGSGKSTILEAISYALYNETERLNIRDGRAYNMMNLKSDAMTIDFEFTAGEKNQERYRFTVRGVRDKKEFAKVARIDRRAFRQNESGWDPIDPKDAAKIIGLNYENFRRTIIIPQGRFQEFLQLGEADRTAMMKEIFNLSRYDLSRQTDSVDRTNADQLAQIEGQLLQVGEVDEDLIAREIKERDMHVEERGRQETSLAGLEKRERELQNWKMLLGRVADAEQAYRDLMAKEPEFSRRKTFLEQFEQCQQLFPDLLNQRRDAQQDLANSGERLRRYSLEHQTIHVRIQKTELAFEKARQEYERLGDLRLRESELATIAGVVRLDDDLKKGESALATMYSSVKSQANQLETLKTGIRSKEEELRDLRAGMPDEKGLMEIKRWVDKRSVLEQDVARLSAALGQQRLLADAIEQRKKRVLSKRPIADHVSAEQFTWGPDRIAETLHEVVVQYRSTAETREHEEEALHHTALLEGFAQKLKDGEPCPLCGATTHPALYAATGMQARLKTLATERKNLLATADALQAAMQELHTLHAEQTLITRRTQECETDLQERQRLLATHEQGSMWSTSILERTDAELERAVFVKTQVSSLEKLLETGRTQLRALESAHARTAESYQALENSLSASKGKRQGLTATLQHFSESDIAAWTAPAIEREIRTVKERIAAIETTFKTLDKQLQDDRSRQSALEESLTKEAERKEEIGTRLGRLEEELRQRLARTGHPDVSHVERILASSLDVRKEQEALAGFFNAFAAAGHQLTSLRNEAGTAAFDEAAYQLLTGEIARAKSDIARLHQEIGQLSAHINQLEGYLSSRRSLEARRRELELRKSDLATLKSLFRASGFVNYASRIHLRNLCGLANQRFMQLTGQKLKLELRDDNAFEVRDFLNDGKLRSVKTLSGGQTFQASLSLALALADSLQQAARMEQNFFFLDEGFGSLDSDSLHIVFDALKSLRKDNRVVGVISHVEEMQQEIENAVVARLDLEKGTILECS
jgi:DNA repair protein SbcC/Rad50